MLHRLKAGDLVAWFSAYFVVTFARFEGVSNDDAYCVDLYSLLHRVPVEQIRRAIPTFGGPISWQGFKP